ncbi:hypothetical protein [Kitasatospora purpeofusca]|uniref:hypothetical protein n=1 Tax=Kitasatospora purpeofusca TaxID=67352 RepID=UPI0035D99B38
MEAHPPRIRDVLVKAQPRRGASATKEVPGEVQAGHCHEVPAYQPQICREMLYDWLFDRPFTGQDPETVARNILEKARKDAANETG